MTKVVRGVSLTIGVVMLALTSAPVRAQRGGTAAGSTLPVPIPAVRTAIGHGDGAEARRLAESATGDASARELALALVEIFEGKDAEARTRLLPLATAAPNGEAALELGLLEIRTGRAEEGRRRLDPLASVRTFAGPDDYLRLARAARGVHEFLLAADAYVRTADVRRADIQAERGAMFLARHRPGDAASDFQKALEIDPKWMPALVGLARALADDDPEASEKALEDARKIAPDYPDVLLLTAAAKLEHEEPAAATDALDRLARVKPNSLEEAAWRAAVAYKTGGLAAADTAAAKASAINPRSGLPYRIAGEEAAREYRFDDAAALARKAVAADQLDPESHFDLGLYLLRTGDEAGARTALDVSWDLDNSNPVTKNLLDLLDDLAGFERVLDGEFIFKFDQKEAAVLKPYALPLAQEAYKTFSTRYGFKPQGPILVEVFPVHDDFAVRTLGLPGLVGALGACFGRVVTMDSPQARPPGEFSWQATLWHEIAHVFTLQLSKYRVPRWLTEGLSTYEEHARQPAWGRELTLEFANLLGKGKTFGVKGLPEAFKQPELLSMAYFEASLVAEYLTTLNGDAGLRALLVAYGDGLNDKDALAKAYGKSVDELDAGYKQFIEQRYGALRDALRDPATQVDPNDLAGLRTRAAAAPNNFMSQLSLGQALVRTGDLAGARAPLERAATLAPPAQGDASPRALLARIAENEGDTARARQQWRALLQYDHANVNAARRLAAVSSGTNARADEDFALRLIADLDPFDADTHGKLGRRLVEAGNFGAALPEFQAALALGPSNLAEAHVDVGEVLLKLGRRDDAKREALLSLKEAPTFARAQDLLLAAIGREP